MIIITMTVIIVTPYLPAKAAIEAAKKRYSTQNLIISHQFIYHHILYFSAILTLT